MNEHVRICDLSGGSEGPLWTLETLSRRRWTTAELLSLVEAGQLDSDLHFELIRGEVVAMPPTGEKHENASEDLADFLIRQRPADVRVKAEPQLNLSDDTYTEPDIVVRPVSIRMPQVRGHTVLLVIEIADSSLDYDTTTKADLYAGHGVREYWVVNARTLATTVFRDPGPTGYARVSEHAPTDLLVPHLAPLLAVRLSELEAQAG